MKPLIPSLVFLQDLLQPLLITLIILLSCTSACLAQSLEADPGNKSVQDSLYKVRQERKQKKQVFLSHLVFAGNLSLQFKPFVINASPLIGYRFTDNLIAGLGPTYIYNKEGLLSSVANAEPTSMQVYGGRVFIARRIYKPIFLQLETEALNYPYYNKQEEKKRDWVINPLAGFSYNMSLGGKSFFQLTVLYNFNYTNNPYNQQLYNSPWIIRLGAGSGGVKK